MAVLLLGKCPDCEGPRKYSEERRATKAWLKCPSPLCVSRPKKIRKQWGGSGA